MATGCTSLQQLENQQINPADGFTQALAAHYLEFAESEAEKYDWSDSAYFARKGLRILKGGDSDPEQVDNWDIPANEISNLKWARNRLMAVLTPQIKADFPDQAAAVVSLYDSWIEEQEENWQDEDINTYRINFLMEIAELEYKIMPDSIKHPGADMQKQPESSADNDKQIIYYDFGKADVVGAGNETISRVLDEVKDMESYSIKVDGYSDRVGSDAYNMKLSGERAKVVARKLLEGGVPSKDIEENAFGEKFPVKVTKDGVAERLNRRVEITIRVSK